jgi:hypothetical protein
MDMRYFTSSLAIVAIVLSLAACTGKSSSSDQSNSTAGSEATAAASSEPSGMGSDAMTSQASAAPGVAAAAGAIPDYPGAAVRSQTSASSVAQTNASGRVLETPDSFDKVYTWYQGKMPAGSERMHLTQPSPSAVFVTYDPNKNQDSVSIVVSHGKTVITIAHVVPRTQ